MEIVTKRVNYLLKSCVTLILLLGHFPAVAQQVTQPLTAADNLWDSAIIPVCWENPDTSNAAGRQYSQDAVEGSWEKESAVNFVGWNACKADSRGIRVVIKDGGPHVKKLGDKLDGVKDGMLLNFTFETWGTGCQDSKRDCIEKIAVHEFGHALGFAHEQNRDDAFLNCSALHQGTDGSIIFTPFDLDSVMNYCNPEWSGDGTLSELDIVGVRKAYGEPGVSIVGFSKKEKAKITELDCSVEIDQGFYTAHQFKRSEEKCNNDEVRSMWMQNVKAGNVFRLFDSPTGKREDDWMEIIVKRDLNDKLIPEFNKSFEDEDVKVVYHRNNGLGGKVSYFEYAPASLGPVIDFYEGRGATQNLVCSVLIDGLGSGVDDLAPDGVLKFTTVSQCDNDEARSMVLHNIPPDTYIRIYDSPKGSRGDDWSEIHVKQQASSIRISSFEKNENIGVYSQRFFRKNGLDGKVSRLLVTGKPFTKPLATFFEGNSGSQDKVCSIAADRTRRVRFKRTRSCENDEARSVVLNNLKAGTKVRVYDDPSCKTSDDWTSIEMKEDVYNLTISSFERSRNRSQYAVKYHKKNGLDGKVSCIRINTP